MKITILKYDHRHGCDLSAYADGKLAEHARAKICSEGIDERIYVPAPTLDEDPSVTVSDRVKELYTKGDYDECVEVYQKYNQDESLDLEEVDVQGYETWSLLVYRGSGSDLATDIKSLLPPHELQRLLEGLK